MSELTIVTETATVRRLISANLGEAVTSSVRELATPCRLRYYHPFGPEAALAIQTILGGQVKEAKRYFLASGDQTLFVHDLPGGAFDPFRVLYEVELTGCLETVAPRHVVDIAPDVDYDLAERVGLYLLAHVSFTQEC